jgi:hypothetical protein
MPAYTFEALDAQGQTRKGVMEAETVKAARSQLRAQTLVPLKVEPVLDGAVPMLQAPTPRVAFLRRARVQCHETGHLDPPDCRTDFCRACRWNAR